MNSGFLKYTDPRLSVVAGWALPQGWWSRPWEYAWALQFARPGQVVADMGCGYTYRPLKDALANTCAHVYAVDASPKVLALPGREHLEYVVADISKPIPAIATGSLDRIFCISVLEDTQRQLPQILAEFARCLKPDGLVILTFDTPYYIDQPCLAWPGLNLQDFFRAVEDAGLSLVGDFDFDITDAVHHKDWNLCVVHCALGRKTG